MNKIVSLGFLTLTIFFMVSCDPEKFDYSLGERPKVEDMNFEVVPKADKPNIVSFVNTSDIVGGAVTWSFANGDPTAKGDSVSANFPFKGDYTIVMTLYTKGGSATISKTVTIAQDDMTLLDRPMYNKLTGGVDNLAGKTWVFDQYHKSHFAVGPIDKPTPIWWEVPAEGKTKSCLYTQEFTFKHIGLILQWKNNGNVYTNAAGKTALAALGFDQAVVPGDGDFDVQYTLAPSYTFRINETDSTITLSEGAFFGHYTGTTSYKILKLTNDELYVRCVSAVEPGNAWYYRFIPKDKNVKPPVTTKAVPLSEDFESTSAKVKFKFQDMGSLTDSSYSNPAPIGINTSKRVFLYQKTAAYYSNIFYDVTGYKFDLTTQNKIKLKVYIPSYNDYTTSYAHEGWANDKLGRKVAVKLQNADLLGNAYTTQKEVSFTNLETDKWIELTFDFSSVSDRKDFNRIVIQFGDEGHAGPGIFFFDDFSFTN